MADKKDGASRRILLVDDDEALRRLIGKILEQSGYAVTEADLGAEALKRLPETDPDLILLDHVLPDMDGLLLLELIRARLGWRQTPIIYLTGMGDLSTKTRAFEAGVVDYVTKPFDPRELVARISTQIRLKDHRDAEVQKNDRLPSAAKQAQEEAE